MKMNSMYSATVLLLTVLTLGACGGSSDDGAGSPTAFSVSPKEQTITAATGSTTCYTGYAGDFLILGGTAPYKLYNSTPQAVQLSTTQVNNRNQTFGVSYIGGWCFDPATITVVDALGNAATITLVNKLDT